MSRRITALNNHGVASLKSGRLNDAILSFRHALYCLRKASSTNVGHYVKTNASSFACHALREGQHQVQLIPARLTCLDPSLLLSISPHNMLEMYPCAFAVSPDSCSTFNMTETSIVVYYNLGLAHHLAGMSAPTSDSLQGDLLCEARRCYKIAGNLFGACHEEHGLTAKISSATLLLGLLNNLGHTHSHFCKVKEVETCGILLDELLESSANMLTEAEGDFFYQTLAYFHAHADSPAPAA